MRKLFSSILLLLSYSFSIGQSKSIDISKIETEAQATAFIEANPTHEGKLFTIKPGQDATEILSPLQNKEQGYTFQIDNCTYKIVNIDSQLSFRVSYIYFDGNKLSKTDIDKTRQAIISRFKLGEDFLNLVKQYNMDGNDTGDTHWFTEKTMMEEFEKAVKSHKKGEIFTVDIPSQNWYHVVLKTHNDSYLKNITILKIKTSS